MRGAGGTEGGLMRFFIGLGMMIGGGYLFFNAIQVSTPFTFGYPIYHVGRFGITSGMVMVPFIFGIGMMFYNSKNLLGWILALGSLVMLMFGVITSIQFHLRSMSAFSLIMILTLMIGGIGLFLSSFRRLEVRDDDPGRWRNL